MPSLRAALKWRESLSFRLFVWVILAVLVVEALIFIPSASNFRTEWMRDRVQAARVAALALEAAPSRMVTQELAEDLLMRAEVVSVAELSRDMREQILASQMPITGETLFVNLYQMRGMKAFGSTLATFTAPDDRLLVLRDYGSAPGRILEVVVPEAPLKAELFDYGRNILFLSLLISLAVGGLIYLLLIVLVIRPVRRVTQSVEQFRDDPGSWQRRLAPTPRRDEIGRAQNALADMERAVSDSFRQQERLALLGEAVAKINHDLRNSLATAQIASDSLALSEDPRVARSLPRLERALERAIGLATDTLKYGRSSVPEANLQATNLHDLVDEAGHEALAAHPQVEFANQVSPETVASVDPDHLHRICANLIRNAAEAMQGEGRVSIGMDGADVSITDTGPGLPGKARENLFKPFAGSTRRDGTGLGLALSRDLARSMGGDLKLGETGPAGTQFILVLARAEDR
ncbi:MAG: HAMP domain-containing histidine kinase [Alphaproteobacteria bacterium]|nr:HAMP domain-containing histidine kinase [Alphaproteobacteria bacterium]